MGRIGIMGGTFDPIHLAHLQMARCAMRQEKLDKVFFMPSKIPPHKKGKRISDERLRSKLVKLALEGEEGFYYSDFELQREGTTYTAKTLQLLKEKNPKEQFYFILGGDSLFQFEQWHQPEKIVKYAVILAASRGSASIKQMLEQAAYLSKKLHGKFKLIQMEKSGISSSLIRKKLAAGESVCGMVPEKVQEYIQKNHCYTELY